MAHFKELSQKTEVGKLVTLYQCDATDLGGDVYAFSDSTLEDGSSIVFDGVTYQAIPIKAEGFEITGNGQLPRPKLTISNIDGTVSPLINSYSDLLGAKITRFIVPRENLDDGTDPDPSSTSMPSVFYIDQKTSQTPEYIEFELAAVTDVENKKLPGRQVIRGYCPFIYRYSKNSTFDYSAAQCPYTGSIYANAQDVQTNDPSQDQCSHTLTGCRVRYGENGTLPFGGFPGVGRY